MHIVFNREPFTLWKIVILDRSIDKAMDEISVENPNSADYMEFSCFYRTTYRDSKECEQFTMMSNEVDYVYLQLQIFKNGDIRYYSKIPISININKKKKRIEILPLAYCTVNLIDRVIDYVPID